MILVSSHRVFCKRENWVSFPFISQFPFFMSRPGAPSKKHVKSEPKSARLKLFHGALTNDAISCSFPVRVVHYITQRSQGQNMKVLSLWSWRRSDTGATPCLSSAPSFVFHLFHPVQLSLRSLQQQTAEPHTRRSSAHITAEPEIGIWILQIFGIGDNTVTTCL